MERNLQPRSEISGRAGVLAVDDQASFRTVVRELVDMAPGFAVVGEASSGEEAVDLARELQPDIVLMDVRMPGVGGIAAARMIKASNPTTVVVLVSTTCPEELPREADECLADEIVWKTHLRPRLLEDIWGRHRGPRGKGGPA